MWINKGTQAFLPEKRMGRRHSCLRNPQGLFSQAGMPESLISCLRNPQDLFSHVGMPASHDFLRQECLSPLVGPHD